jgi:hypothetical protein|tara:strand:+ start:11463 stop:11855 length:393 start_codon:yes stop_codon:yes gene_type:complete
MSTQLNNLAIFVNGQQVAYEADSLEWTSGFGEYMIRNAVVGGSVTEQVFSEDLKTKFSDVKFGLPTTIANVNLVRGWKVAKNTNVVEIVGSVDGETISQIFTQAALLSDPANKAATEGTIDLEWKSNPAQ